MGVGHGHGHVQDRTGSGSASARHRWRLVVAFGLIGSFFVVELIAGLLANSLALLSDAGHMAADVVALGAALAATHIAVRPDKSGRRTYGRYRAEVFASGIAVLLMIGVGIYITIEAISRIGEPVEVATGWMIWVGLAGLLINIVALLLLRGGASESLNVKGAYLEVLADTLGSVGVIVAGILIAQTGNAYWDTAIALAIALFVVVRAVLLAREVLAVLGQHAPQGIVPDDVATDLIAVPAVLDVHDLHLWTLTSGMNVATAHLVAAAGHDPADVLAAAQQVLLEKYGIDHATLQVETDAHSCHGLSW